jgi:glycosyltransferase involved in cell wall biosynthesis
MIAPRRYTLVTTGNVSTTPRLVKAADALTAAGHRVRVVALTAMPVHERADAAVMASRGWELVRVDVRHGTLRGAVRRGWHGVRQWGARLAWGMGFRRAALADRVVSRYLDLLARAAGAAPADVVIGHTLGALPVAARAARALGAALAFDSEDLHSEELPATPEHARARAVVGAVEARYLPRCRYVTASADGIADALAERYGLARPAVVLNTFPLADRPARMSPRRRPAMASLYWYSQLIGAGRGLEDALDALALLDGRATLHLRGRMDPSYRAAFDARVGALRLGDRVQVHDVVSPPELVRVAAEHDIGLALEQPHAMNRELCVTNKLCTYLLAGLAVVATDTRGQRGILADAPGAGVLYPPGDAPALARALAHLIESPDALRRAQGAARAAAERRYAWEHDAPRLVSYL